MFRIGVLIWTVLLLAPSVWAADGGDCDSDVDKLAKGNWKTQTCVQLCDGKAAADSSCTEWNFNSSGGMPDQVILEYEDVGADCSATPEYTFTTGPTTGGSPSYNFDTTAVVITPTVNRITIIIKEGSLNTYLFTAIADDADCTDVDIRMYLVNREGQ